MNQPNAIEHNRPSVAERIWDSAGMRGLLMLAATLAFVMPGPAAAQGFNEIGNKLETVFCSFIKSPIITIFVGVAMLGLFIVAAMNEDNKMLSTILKVVVAGCAIVFLPGLLNMIGFSPLKC